MPYDDILELPHVLHQFEVWDSHINKHKHFRLQRPAASPTLMMDKTGAPAKHFQQSTELDRVTSQKTSLETWSMFHNMSTTSQKLQYLNITRPKHTLCPNYCPANIILVAYSSLYSWLLQIHCMHCQTWLLWIYCIHIHICTTGCYRYPICIFRCVQLLVIDMPYAYSDVYSCWL
jgi:hypothetical protein